MTRKALVAAAGVGTGVVLAGVAAVRWLGPRHVRWGATDDEVAMALPGDDLLADATTQVTRAITIDAPPEAVWPWVVQIGADRGGFYSYDVLENLFGLGIHSADQVVDEWQDRRVGDLVAADRAARGGWYVVDLRPNELLVLQVANVDAGRPVRRDEPPGWAFQWTFALLPTLTGGTRLVIRERVAFSRAATRVVMAPVGYVSFVMTRRMLQGIKERAERAVA